MILRQLSQLTYGGVFVNGFSGSKNNATRVCHIARDIELSGGGEVVKQVARHMAASGASVVVITDTGGIDLGPDVLIRRTLLGATLLGWAPTSRVGWYLRHFLQILVFTFTSSLLAFPLRLKGYVVFNHNCESLVGQILVMHNVFSAELARRRLSYRARFVASLTPIRFMRTTKERLLSKPLFGKTLVSVSEQTEDDIAFLGVSPSRIVTIDNGVDVEKFSDLRESRSSELFTDRLPVEVKDVVLFVGHEWKRKGLDELLEAVSMLPLSYGLAVVGGSSENKKLYERRTQELEISSRVHFAGTQRDVRGYFATSRVFCLPSHYETMPLVALESLAAGVPVVLTPACPASQLVTEGVNGFVTSHRPEDIAEAIVKASELGRSAHSKGLIRESVADHDWKTVGENYLQLARSYRASRGSVRVTPLHDADSRA